MSDQMRDDALRKVFMALWAFVTLVLVFLVILLVGQMMEQGQDPLSILRAPQENASDASALAAGAYSDAPGQREVRLYFASADATRLAPATANIAHTDSTVENCRAALRLLIAGPPEGLTPILPPDAQVLALYLLGNGELVVDLSREIISFHTRFKSAGLEALMTYGIVNTLTQPALAGRRDGEIRSVRLLLEGSPPVDTFPAHLDWSAPLTADPRWAETPRSAP